MPVIRWFLVIALSYLLTACGGGGSIEKGTTDGTNPTESVYTVKISTENNNNQLSVETPLIAKAFVTKDGNPLANARVIFNVDNFATLNPNSGSVLTSTEGYAFITLEAIEAAGAGELTATVTVSDKNYIDKFLFFSSGGVKPVEPSQIQLEVFVKDKNDNNFNASNPITKLNPGTIYAKLTNNGAAISSQLIEFQAKYTGKIEPEIGTGITDDNGVAEITITSGDNKGAGQVIAKYLDEEGKEYLKTAVFYSSGDAAIIDSSTLLVDLFIYTDCPAGWDLQRDTTPLRTLAEQNGCKATNKINTSELVDIVVQIKDSKSGDGVANTLTSLSADLGRILPESGKTISDAFGFSLLKLQPSLQGGAGLLTATVNTVEKTLAFETGSQDIELVITNGLTKDTNGQDIPLGAGETTLVRVEIKDNLGNLITTPLDVEFSSGCSQLGKAVIDPKTTSVGGIALSTYRNTGCQISTGDDVVVTVSKGGSTETSQVNIPVAPAKVTSIEFLDVSEKVLAIKGSGGKNRKEYSEVSFKLINSIGGDVANQRMDFRIVGTNGDVYLSSSSIDTDSAGIARVIVNAGNVPSTFVVQSCYVPASAIPVSSDDDVTCWREVYASCQADPKPDSCPRGQLSLLPQDTLISSISSRLAITSGVPVESSFTVSSQTINTETGNFVNVEVPVTVNAADRYGNFVPDGTQIYLTAEGGAVGTKTGALFGPTLDCEIIDGNCSAVWVSQNRTPFSENSWGNQINSYNPKLLYKSKRDYLIGLGNANPTDAQIRAVANSELPAAVLESTRNCDLYFGSPAPCVNGILNAAFDPNGVPLRGRVTLLAKTLGEENFNDVNGNGIYDLNEFASIFDSSEAFRDDNENGVYEGKSCLPGQATNPCDPVNTNAGHFEQLFDTDGNGIFTDRDGKYNGLSCSDDAYQANQCTRTLVDVWDETEIIMSGSVAYSRFTVAKGLVINAAGSITYSISDTCDNLVISNGTISRLVLALEPSDLPAFCDVQLIDLTPIIVTQDLDGDGNNETYDVGLQSIPVFISFSDSNNNPLPADTVISITSDNGKYSGISETIIPNSSATSAMQLGFSLSRESEPNSANSGVVQVNFETPKGTKTSVALTVRDAG